MEAILWPECWVGVYLSPEPRRGDRSSPRLILEYHAGMSWRGAPSMRFLRLSFVLFLATLPAFGQTSRTSERPNQVLTQEVVISGTVTLDTQQLQDISNSLTSRRFRDDEHEIKQRIQGAFQQMGYFDAEVTNLKVRALDPLARPKPVRIEAEVTEGARYKFGAFQFTGNQALSSAELTEVPISSCLHLGARMR